MITKQNPTGARPWTVPRRGASGNPPPPRPLTAAAPARGEQEEEEKQAGLFQVKPYKDPEFEAFKEAADIKQRKETAEGGQGRKKKPVSRPHLVSRRDMVAEMVDVKEYSEALTADTKIYLW